MIEIEGEGCIRTKFPKKPDVLLSRETSQVGEGFASLKIRGELLFIVTKLFQIDDRRRQLESYLQSIVKSETYKRSKDLVRTTTFIETTF